MSPESILNLILAIISIEFFFDLFLEILNLRHQGAEVPEELRDIYTTEQHNKSQSYQKEHTVFGFVTSGATFIISFVLLKTGGFGYLNNLLLPYFQHPILLALAFFGIIYIISDIAGTPFQWYSTFVIEQKYGFNKMTLKTFVLDKLKGYALTAVLGSILIGVLLFLITWIGPQFWWIFWIFIAIFIVCMNVFYTSVIVPIFNKLTPLEDGELKTGIMDYCRTVGFPLDNLFVIDGSKRSSKANAYFSGLGSKKKIVLYDTLINDHSHEELVGVLAHEVGHFKKKHIYQGIVIAILQVGITLFILSLMVFNPDLSTALGSNQNSIHINLLAFGILYSPISTLTGLLMSVLSRKNEYEADNYAKTTFGASPLIAALKKLSANNLSNITPHPWYVFFHYSHPTLLQRIRNLNA